MAILSSDSLSISDRLLKRGFTIFQSDNLKNLAGVDVFERYRKNVMSFRAKLRKLFELDLSVKRGFEAAVTSYVPELNGFGPGWWPESKFPDPIENVDYDIQYILSKIYDESHPSTMFDFDGIDPDISLGGRDDLPNLESNFISDFLSQFVLNRLREDLAANLNVSIPKLKQQFEIAYYPRKGLLPKHTDTPFLMGNIGPTQNLYILPFDTREPYQVFLEEGEILLYTGREFRELLTSVDRKLPTPMPHWVNGSQGRIAILLPCFASRQ